MNTIDFSGAAAAGKYELYSFDSGAPALDQFALGTLPSGAFNYFLTVTGSQIDLMVTNPSASAAWNFNGSGNYGDSTKWDPTTVPNAPGDVATFGNGTTNLIGNPPTAAINVTIDGNYTVGGLVFDNTNGTTYNLSYGGADTGLTLNNNGAGATLTVASGAGSPTILTNITLADNTTFNVVDAASNLLLSLNDPGVVLGEADGSHSLTKTGAGTLTIDRTSSYTGGTTVSDGTLTVTATGSIGSGPLEVDGDTSILNLDNATTPQTVGGLSGSGTSRVNVAAGAALVVQPAAGTSTYAGTLSLAAGSPAGSLSVAGAGTEVLTAAPQLGNGAVLNVSSGTLKVAATVGTVSVGTGVTANVSGTGTLELAGSLSALGTSTVGQRVDITNNSTAAAGVLISDGAATGRRNRWQRHRRYRTARKWFRQPDGRSYHGRLAGHRRRCATSSALLTIDASDTSGNPTASGGFALAGSLVASDSAGAAASVASLLAARGAASAGSLPAGASLGGSASGGSVTAVPEPSSILLLILGALTGLAPALRRRFR